MANSVNIVHTATDAELAGKVASYLEAQSIPCLVGGKSGPKSANEDEWSILLLVLSQNANDEEAILQEVSAAIAANKILIPFRIENFRPDGEMQDHLRWRYVHEAFSPPLEKHLEELVRMIKPLLHGRSPRLSEATSISRTLPSRAAILRKPDRQEAGTQPGRPLHIYLNFPHLVLAGHPTTIQCRLENTGSRPLTAVRPLLECRGFKHDTIPPVHELPAGKSEMIEFEIQPGGFGQFNLRVTVQWQQDETICGCSGTHALRIYEAPAPGEFPAILQQFSQVVEGTTLSQQGRAAIPLSVASSEELARFKLPEHFERLDLALDYDVQSVSIERAENARPLTIPSEFLALAQTGTVLQLTPVGVTEADPYQAIRLVGRPQFVLGRSGEESDFVLWFWPRNEVHDTKTRRMSKKHVTFSIEARRILVRNTAAGSLTTYDGQDVSATGTPLQRRGLLNLSGIYLLDVMHVPGLSNPLQINNIADWQGHSSASAAATARGSMRLLSRTAGVLPQNSTWLLSDATFGSSPFNPVILDVAGLADIQGRFHYAHGAFWLESFAENSAVQLNEHPLSAGWIAPLTAGQTLRLGSASYSVHVST